MIQRARITDPKLALSMVLSVDRPRGRRGSSPVFAARVTNEGCEPVVLVQPGDGSEAGFRTPYVGWSVLRHPSSRFDHPDAPPLAAARKGNVDPLDAGELFVLRPGRSRALDLTWTDPPALRAPGIYRVVLYYENDPLAPFLGVPFDEHDPIAVARVRESTPCLLRSNELRVRVEGGR